MAGTKISKNIKLRGKNKIQVETQWIEHKGDAGFQFRLMKSDKENEVK